MGKSRIPTAEELSSLKRSLRYDHGTGFLYRVFKKPRGGRVEQQIAMSPSSNGYLSLRHEGRSYLAHRVAWFLHHGTWPVADELDHKDRDRTNNRIDNLVPSDHVQNQHNQSLMSSNRSGLAGVYWEEGTGRWRAELKHHGKRIRLGSFKDLFSAAAARLSANTRYGFSDNHGKAPRCA